ncbi:MAG: LytTR family transcriptional regulator DNA-binding domain-containing protein [Eggerthellaceae bacterium]|nr:LytTR family transcriptional regulator DNA-binding domain-containing protein [Eggerthellaceae bacterium]
MIQIALPNNEPFGFDDVDSVVCNVAGELGCAKPILVYFKTSIELLDMLVNSGRTLIDLVFVPYDLPGLNGIEALAEARASLPLLRSVITAESPDHAAKAAAIGVNGYLLEPVDLDEFVRVLRLQLQVVLELHGSSTLLNTRACTRRIRHDSVLYCETSGHDQVLHLVDGESVAARYSSQALFELLGGCSYFFKLGSSYIVNLLEVVSLNTSSGELVLSNGISLPVPTRLRKALEETLLG